jgi:hypothetical protein
MVDQSKGFCPQLSFPSAEKLFYSETNPGWLGSRGRTFAADFPRRSYSMPARIFLLVLAFSTLTGCNNTLNPLCGSARPAPVIGSLSPSTVTFAEVEKGVVLTVNGSDFVPASEIMVNNKALAATALSSQQLQVTLTPDVISGPGPVNIKVLTPSGNSGNVGCSSGGTSTSLVLTVN